MPSENVEDFKSGTSLKSTFLACISNIYISSPQVQDFQHQQPLDQSQGIKACHDQRRPGSRDYHQSKDERRWSRRYSARDCRRSSHQAVQERTRHQRPPQALLACQELFRFVVDQERHLLSPTRPVDHQPATNV